MTYAAAVSDDKKDKPKDRTAKLEAVAEAARIRVQGCVSLHDTSCDICVKRQAVLVETLRDLDATP